MPRYLLRHPSPHTPLGDRELQHQQQHTHTQRSSSDLLPPLPWNSHARRHSSPPDLNPERHSSQPQALIPLCQIKPVSFMPLRRVQSVALVCTCTHASPGPSPDQPIHLDRQWHLFHAHHLVAAHVCTPGLAQVAWVQHSIPTPTHMHTFTTATVTCLMATQVPGAGHTVNTTGVGLPAGRKRQLWCDKCCVQHTRAVPALSRTKHVRMSCAGDVRLFISNPRPQTPVV